MGGKSVSFHAILSMAENIKYKFNESKTLYGCCLIIEEIFFEW